MLSHDQIKATLMLKLHKRGSWGVGHAGLEGLKKGWKQSELGELGLERIGQITRELVRHGAIITKATSHGAQVSLDPRQSEEIIGFMRGFFPDV
jgi:hypothetical protein